MSAAECAVESCGRPVKDQSVCVSCADKLEQALSELPALADELEVTLTRQARLGGGDGGRKNAETPLVFHYAASETKYVLRNTLVGWVRELSSDGLGVDCGDTVADMARWLLARVNILAQHPAGGEAVEEICSAVAAVERVIDRPPGRTYGGICDGQEAIEPDDTEPCGYELHGKPGSNTVRCPVCGITYDVEARQESMRAQLEYHCGSSSYVAMVASGLGVKVSSSTIRMWVKRDKLQPRYYMPPQHEDGKPRPMYRVGDVVRVAAGEKLKEAV